MAEEIEEFYKRIGKEHVDMLFDKRFLNDELSREAIGGLEDYMGFLFQSHCEQAKKSALLLVSLRNEE